MNKRCYKVIFSKTLNCLVVVSEWAKSSGKSDNRTSSPQPKQIFNSTCRAMQRLSVSVLLSLGLATLSFSASADGIFEDVTAPRNQQPMVTQTASGVPQVNIQTPSAAGVSMNQYSQFDVDKKGAVLANNRKATKAQIAGWVDANPYMARGEADVIVNQVNGNNPSQLNGYVEVAGKRADVIIANPSGIAVNGGGFLNVNKTILSTGQTQLSDGKVTGHSINQGEITIAGQGLDVRDGNYTALLSRSAEINAGIYKGDGKLDVITGVNDVDASGNITHSTAVTNDDKKPTVAIDTGKLGGMYAGSIRLVGTETGVGVNNAGQIQTNQLTLSADGTLSNSGQVVSETSNITSTSLDNSGTINTGELQLSTSKIANSGSITQTGSQSLTITAQNLTNSGGVGISKNKSDTANHSANTPDKTSSTTDNQSPKNFADGHINVTESIENTGNITAGGEVVLDLNDGLSNSGTVKVEKATLENGKLDNSGELFINQANLNGATFNNTIDGSINIDKADAFNFTQRIDNAGQISVTDKINWDTQQFNNTDTGTIYTDKTFTLTTQQTDNAGQLIADDNVSIKSKKTTNTGKVQSQKQLSVTGSRLENKEKGQLTAKQIKIDNATINNAGEINQVGNGHLAITTDSLTNDGNVGKLLQTSKASTDKTDTSTTKKQDKATDKTTDKQSSGTTDANGSITSQQLTNTGSIVNNGKTSLTVSETLTNKAKGSIDVNTLNATTKQLDNSGSISADDATLSGKTFNNSGALSAKKINTVNYSTKINNTGELVGKDTFTIQSPLLFNSGKINGAESIQFSTDDWTNKGTVIAEQNITIANGQSASDKVINSGILTAGKKIGIKSSTLANNTKGSIQSNHLVIASDNAVNDGKIIQTGSNDLSITADTVANKKGAVLGKNVSDTKAKDSKTTTTDSNASDKQADSNNKNIGKTTGTLTVSNTLINTGQLVAGGDVSLATDTKLDNQGQINVSQLTHKSGELNNSGGQLTADTMSLSGKTLDNNKGTLQANTFSQFNFVDKIDNQAGKIIGQADYSISTQRLDNTQKGSVSGANNLDIKADNVDTDGSIIAGKNLSITGDSQKDSHITNQGDISAHQKLTVNTKKVANKSESAKISAKTLQITTDNLTNKGTISQTDDASLLITAKNISNNESASLGAAVSEASATVNTASKSDTKAKPSNTASGYITVADSITNDNAINAGGKTSITATDKLSNAGTIKTNKLNVQGQLSNNKTIITDDAAIDVSQLDNQGEISAEKFNTLNATDFSNTGKIQGKESYTVNAKQIKNTGKNSQLTSDNALTIHSDTIENQGVVVAKSSTLDVAESLVNDGTIHAEKDVTVTGKDASITNSGAIQSASASLDVQAKSLTNQTGGRLFAAQDATLDVAEKIKNSGDVHANNLLKLFAQSLENHKKAAFSSKDLIIKSDTVDNAGTIRSTVLSATTNQLNNTGDVNAKQLTAKADTLSNTGVIRADNTSVEGSTLTNHGTLTAKKFNKIDFATLINSGILFGVKDYIINAKILKNTGGDSQISTTEKLTIKADTVHNEGKVAAKAQEIKVSEKLDNVGTIYADTSVTIDSDKQATITNSSVIQAGQSLDIDAKTLDNKKTLVAGKNIQLDTADNLNNSGTINAKTLEVSTVSLDNTGNIQQTSTGNLQITANKTINKKDAVLGQLPKTDNKNEKKTTSPNVDKDTQTSPSHITVTGTLNNAGTITGNGKVSLDTKEGLQNQGKINLDTFSLSSGVLDNQSGILQAQAMDFDASQLLNAKGLLTAKKFTNFVFSNGIDNKAGTISGQEDFSIRTDATFDNTEDGKVFAGDNLTIKANQLDNAGKVFSINTLSLAIKKALNNKKNISAQQLVISADSLANQGTITQSGKGNMVIGADSIINRKNANLGSALATKTTSTDKGGKDNTDSITADGLITVNHLLDNAGNIVASGNTDITAHNGLDNQGVIKAKNLTSQQGEFSNTNKVLADTASINSSTLTNSGELSAKTFIHVKADQLTNSGKIIGTDSYVIDAKKLTNKGKDSSLASQNTLTTKATTITNEGLIEAKQQTINVTDALTNSGTIDAENKLSVSGGKTANITNKKLIQSKTSDVAITGKSLKNTSATATIYAGGKLDVATEKAVNNAGTMSSAETLTVKADSLTNTNKATIQAKTTDITVTKQLANDGTISAKTKQTLKAQQLINKGTLGATEEQKIDVDQLDNQNIITTGKLTITSDTLNNSGSITQTGSRNLAISAGTLENKETIGHEARATPLPKENSNVTTPPADAGKIAVTGKVTNKGTINAGGRIDLTTTTELDNSGTVIVNNLTTNGTSFKNSKTLTAEKITSKAKKIEQSGTVTTKTFTIEGKNQTTVNNTGTVNTNSADWSCLVALKNTGKILVAKDWTLGTTIFNNLKNAIAKAQGALNITGQIIDNDGQIISKSQHLDISKKIDNKGIIASAELQKIRGGATLQNTADAEIDAGAMDWKLSSLTNDGAIIHTGSKTLAISANAVDNDKVIGQSPIKLSNKAAKLADKKSSATNGNVGSSTATNSNITVSGTLSNTGYLVSNHETTLTTNSSLDNSNIISVSKLTAKGQSLDNSGTIDADTLSSTAQRTHNTDEGQIVGNDLSFTGSELTNQGTIGAEEQLTIDVSNRVDNRSGHLKSKKNLSVTADELDNTSGEIQAAAQTTLNVAGTLTNNDGDIYGNDVNADFNVLHNQGGRIAGKQTATLTGTTSVDNNTGELVAGKQLTLKGDNLSVDNTNGTIESQDVSVTAKSLTGDAGIKATRDLGLHIQDDLTLTTNKVVNRHLDITSQGNIDNNAILSGGQTVHVEGQTVNNNSTGRIISNDKTHIEAQTLTNEGEINSNGLTHLDVKNTLTNQPTGKIYGDTVAIEANTLTNNKAEKDIGKDGGAIGARKHLAIGAKHINNYGGNDKVIVNGVSKSKEMGQAELVSLGSLSIGGELDNNLQVTGQADTLVNKGGLIEAKGDGYIAVKDLENLNSYFYAKKYLAKKEWVEEYGEKGRSETFIDGIDGDYSRNKKNVWFNFYDPNKKDLHWHKTKTRNVLWWDYYQYTYKQLIKDNNPGKIIIGGNLNIAGDQWKNNQSQIIVGGVLSGGGHKLIKTPEILATKIIEKRGKSGHIGYKRHHVRRNTYVHVDNKNYYEKIPTNYKFEKPVAVEKSNTGTFKSESKTTIKDSTIEPINKEIKVKVEGSSFIRLRKEDIQLPNSGLFTVDTKNPNFLIKTDPNFLGKTGSAATVKTVSVGNDKTQSVTKEQIESYSSQLSKADVVAIKKVVLKDTDTGNNASNGGNNPVAVNSQSISDVKEANINSVSRTVENIAPVDATAVNLDKIAVALQEKATSRLKDIEDSIDTTVIPQGEAPQIVQTKAVNPEFIAPYVPAKLANNPALKPDMHKRIGDMYYEQRLVQDQITQLTGRRFAAGYENDLEQYKALLDNGAEFAEQYELIPGVRLSPEQMKRLTTDLIWLENQEVTLPNGSKQMVTVPRVYLRSRNTDVNTAGSLISAKHIDLKADTINNQGTMVGFESNSLKAKNINVSGRVVGGSVNIDADNKVDINGGSVVAEDKMIVKGKTVDIKTTTSSYGNDSDLSSGTVVNRVAGLYLTGSDKPNAANMIAVQAENDINLKGANIVNNAKGNGITQLVSEKGSVNIDTVTTKAKEGYGKLTDRNHRRVSVEQEVGSRINSNTDIVIKAGDKITVRQGDINSSNGVIAMRGENGVDITEGRSKSHVKGASYSKDRGFLSSTKRISRYDNQDDLAVASNVTGKKVIIHSGDNADINIQGSNVISDNATFLKAGKNVNIEAAKNYLNHNEFNYKKKSGIFSGGGLSLTIGSQKQSTDSQNTQVTHTGSMVGTVKKGNTTIIAGEKYTQTGSAVNSVDGDVNVLAKQIEVTNTIDTATTDTKNKFKQRGLTVSLSAPVIDTVTGLANTVQTVGKSKNSRVNAMAAANTAYQGYEAAKALQNPTAGISLSVSLGSQKSQSSSHTEGGQVVASTIKGKKVNLVATGGDKSSITIQGSDVAGTESTGLIADHDVTLLAADGTSLERSNNKSSGGSIGLTLSAKDGLAVTLAGNKGKGYGNGDSVTYRNTHIGSTTGKTTIIAGNKLTMKGAQAIGKGIKVSAKDLDIESLQDNATYKGKQKNIGGSLTVGINGNVSGSINASKSNIKADHLSVSEQSGIFAGDDGFDVKIDNHTDLKGGIITSTAKAEAEGKNSFSTATITTSDLQNHSEYDASSLGVSASAGFTADLGLGKNAAPQGADGKTGKQSIKVGKSIGYGSDSDKQNSVTKSAIGTANITITDKAKQAEIAPELLDINNLTTDVTTDTVLSNKGLQNTFNKEAVQSEVGLQVKVTQDFDKTRQGVKRLVNEKIATLKQKVDKGEASQKELDNLQTASLIIDGIGGALYTPNANGLIGDVVHMASPHIAKQIGDYFTGDKKGTAAHGLAHTIIAAATAAAGGNDALTAGLSAGTSEIATPHVAKWLYGTDDPEKLTAEQKQTVSNIMSLASTAVGTSTSNTTDAVASGRAAQNAVDNNAVNLHQANTIDEFIAVGIVGKTKNPGKLLGKEAHEYVLTLNDTDWKLEPEQTGYLNKKESRYIYTKNGGWIDMVHFMFYAGEAYEALNNGQSPEQAIQQAYQKGYRQENLYDYVNARHSYFSYEDLPSDWHGANFAAKYFDSKSNKTLGEQIKNYFNKVLDAKQPTEAPNYHMLPRKDTGKHPGFYNKTKEPYDFKTGAE